MITNEKGRIMRAARRNYLKRYFIEFRRPVRRLWRKIDRIIAAQKAKGTPFMPASMKVDRAQVIIDRMAEKAPRGAYNARKGVHYE